MNVEGLADRLVAVLAMLVSIRPLLRGTLGSRSHISWKRCLVLLGGGLTALVGVVGLLALKTTLLGGPFYLPSWLGGLLAFSGGTLGVSTLIARRGAEGLSEDSAIRYATQAAAMAVYLAAPRVALAGLGLTRLLRAALPWTVSQHRWARIVEGAILMALVAVPRDETLGGLRLEAADLMQL